MNTLPSITNSSIAKSSRSVPAPEFGNSCESPQAKGAVTVTLLRANSAPLISHNGRELLFELTPPVERSQRRPIRETQFLARYGDIRVRSDRHEPVAAAGSVLSA
jgi:hypothetical protein